MLEKVLTREYWYLKEFPGAYERIKNWAATSNAPRQFKEVYRRRLKQFRDVMGKLKKILKDNVPEPYKMFMDESFSELSELSAASDQNS